MITANGGKQSSDLFRSVRIIAKNTQGKSIIKLNEVMYAPESPCNIISNGIFKSKGLYLDGQCDIIHNGHQIVANCPILKGINVQLLELHPDNETIPQEQGISLAAIKS